ncbi:oxidoreductase, partial [Streptomyces sp. NPDC059409]
MVLAAAVCAAALAALTAVPAQAHPRPQWDVKDTGISDVRFRGLAAVSRHTAWVGGPRGPGPRTTAGG